MKLHGLVYGYKQGDSTTAFSQCIAVSTDGSEEDHAEVVELLLELYSVQSELGDFNFYVWMPNFPHSTLGEAMPRLVHFHRGTLMLDAISDIMIV